MGKLFGFLIMLLVIVGALGAGAWFYGQHVYTKEGPASADGKPRVVVVDNGDHAQAIATKLKAAGAIEDEFQFRAVVRVLDFFYKPPADEPKRPFSLKAGEYDIPSGASMKDVIALLETGQGSYYTVVVPEGLTSQMIVDLLEAGAWNSTNPIYAPSAEEIEKQKAAYDALPPDKKPKTFIPKRTKTLKLGGTKPLTPAEGVLLPGDYAVSRGATMESVVRRMIAAQKKLLEAEWPKRQPGLPVKTQDEALILASVVQNEAGNSGEQERVASVFINRLRKPMRLESDPTIVYGITKGYPLGHGITVSERANVTPWNTYQIDGLPKTPICNPGAASIKAVLNPPTTPFYYFVANGTVNHAFATTYSEHLRNVADWREVEKQRDAARNPPPPAKAPAKPAVKPAAKPSTPKPAKP